MASIKLGYIFIEKKKHESMTTKDLIEQIIDEVVDFRDGDSIRFDCDKSEAYIKYRMIQKRKSSRCYLELETVGLRVNKAIEQLQKIDEEFSKSSLQEFYYYIKEYDGISESFCKRLYPKYAQFERKLRRLVLLILTKAYGSDWSKETISRDMLDGIKKIAKGNVTLSTTLENMNLATLEEYLFKKRSVDYSEIISTELSTANLEKMGKEEICVIIEKIRPTSLWERNFKECGDGEEWKNRIESIHDVRNKIAHQKSIIEQEYKATNNKLNFINRELDKVVFQIQEQNFTEFRSIDILGSFTLMEDKLKNGLSIVFQKMFQAIVINFSKRIQEIVKPIETEIMSESIRKFGNSIAEYSLKSFTPDTIEKIASISMAQKVRKNIIEENGDDKSYTDGNISEYSEDCIE